MEGKLLDQVIAHTGLPEEQLEPWFVAQVEARGYNPYDLSLEQLREVMVDMLQDLILATEDESSQTA